MGKVKHNQSGFGAIEALLIAVIVGIIGFTGWYVWNSKQLTDNTLSASTSTTTQSSALSGNLTYVKAKEPTNWIEDHQQGSQIYSLTNDSLGCYVGAGIVKPKADLRDIQPAAGDPSRQVELASGKKVTIYEVGLAKEYNVSEGYIVEKDFDVSVTVACKDKTNFTTADKALQGIKLY